VFYVDVICQQKSGAPNPNVEYGNGNYSILPKLF